MATLDQHSSPISQAVGRFTGDGKSECFVICGSDLEKIMDLDGDSSSSRVERAAGDEESNSSTSVRDREDRVAPGESESDGGASADEERGAAEPDDDSDDGEDEEDDGDGGYDSDTQIVRIADSAASFTRRCIACGEFLKALVALRNVVKVAEPPSPAYAQCVLLVAQLFQLTKHFDASLAAMMDVFTCMPAPYTRSDGLLIIARLYELKGAPDSAAFWWKKLLKQQGTNLTYQQQDTTNFRAKEFEDFANRSFAQRDFLFALDAFTELFHKHRVYYCKRKSYALMYKHLHSALQVLDPEANHKLERQQLAWELARIACDHHYHEDQDQAAEHMYEKRYGDADFYNLRSLYFASFPAIYRAVFAWDDAPARVFVQWWRACRECHRQQQQERLEKLQREEELERERHGEKQQLPPSQPKVRRAKTKKTQQSTATTKPSRAQTRARSPGKEPETSLPKSHKAPSFKVRHKRSSSKKALGSAVKEKQRNAIAPDLAACEEETKAQQQTNQCDDDPAKSASSSEMRSLSSTSLSYIAQPVGRQNSTATRQGRGGLSRQQHRDEFYESSPTKRKLSAVRHLRKQNLVDDLSDLPLSKPPPRRDEVNKDVGQEEDRSQRNRASLLELYPLPSPTAPEPFLASAGRAPGFADLDLDELEKYVRVAHYRARVLIQKHVDVKQLDKERVKPQWLLSFEKTEAMIVDLHQHQQIPAEDTTPIAKPHLTQIHSRVVFQLTAILKQYKRDFGDTSFTRQLHALIQRLSTWKYDQIPMLLAAMENARKAGVCEEKQRNLEFFHVHQGRQQQTGECST